MTESMTRTMRRCALAVVLEVALWCAAEAVPAQVPRQFLIIGDSIGRGTGVWHASQTWTSYITRRHRDFSLLNISRGGWSVAGPTNVYLGQRSGGGTVQALLLPNDTLIELGTNDWSANVPMETFRSVYMGLLLSVRYWNQPGGHVYCLTPIWRREEGQVNTAGLTIADYRQAISEVCTQWGGEVIDGFAAVPHSERYFVDGLHPNIAGHARLGLYVSGRVH